MNYAQWRSEDDFQAIKNNPAAGGHMKAAADLAEFEPIVCEVVESISSDTFVLSFPQSIALEPLDSTKLPRHDT